MTNRKQEILLERVPSFKARLTERLACHFYTMPGADNFVLAEQIHIHYALGECRTDYFDLVDYWLSSLFNVLEDRFEAHKFEECALESLWRQVLLEEVGERTTFLFQRLQTSNDLFILPAQPYRAYCMMDCKESVIYLVETETGYSSFFWHRART